MKESAKSIAAELLRAGLISECLLLVYMLKRREEGVDAISAVEFRRALGRGGRPTSSVRSEAVAHMLSERGLTEVIVAELLGRRRKLYRLTPLGLEVAQRLREVLETW